MLKKQLVLFSISVLIFIAGCSSEKLPIDKIKKNLSGIDTYSIILEDMKEEGSFSPSFFHKYRVITPDSGHVTPWLQVDEDYYQLNSGFLGMTLVNKKEGGLNDKVSPPGYEYVGDSNYGQWRQDSSGNSFWEFYGKYALLSHLMGGWYRPVYRYDYNMYRDYARSNRVYYGHRDRNRNSGSSSGFGSKRKYGSSGSVTKSAKPDFFERRKARETSFQQKFKNNLNQKIGRTKTSDFRGKAGRIGK